MSLAAWLDGARTDVVFAWRSLARTPGLAVGILLTLALGLGVNTAMFSLLETIFFRPPAGVVQPEQVRRVWAEVTLRDGRMFWPGFSYPHYDAIARTLGPDADAAVYEDPRKGRLGRGEAAREVQVSYASAGYFPMLGVHASRGRLYGPAEDDVRAPQNVAVLSDALWHRELRGDESVLGRTIVVSGRSYTVIGVAQPAFTGVDLNAADLWLPVAAYPGYNGGARPWWQSQGANAFNILIRPRSTSAVGQLEQRLTATLRIPEVRQDRGDSGTIARVGSILAANGPGEMNQEIRIAIRVGGVTLVVLLIACANVVNLLLARAMRRRREIAVRLALGISRARLIRLLLAESMLLATGACAAAVLAGTWGASLIRTLLLPEVHWSASPIDWRVMLFTACTALLAGFAAGAIPAIQSASPELVPALKAGGSEGMFRRSRLRGALVAAQAALAVVLLAGAALFVRSLSNVRHIDIGFDASSLVVARITFDEIERRKDPTLGQRILEVADRARRIPGVEVSAVSSMQPMGGFAVRPYFTDRDSLGSRADWRPTITGVTPGFFAATGLRVLRGRDLPSVRGAPLSVVVNEEMARGVWPDRESVGQCLRFSRLDGACYQVVGVVENSRRGRVIEAPVPQYYVLFDQFPKGGLSLSPDAIALRTSATRAPAVTHAMTALLRQAFPGGIPAVVRLSDYLEPQYRPWRLGATLFSAFGILALVVAVVGIYSTISYSVTRRTREFGMRAALGASTGDVIRQVLGEGVRTVAIGVAIGVALALAGGRFVETLLYGITPSDRGVLASVTVVLLLVAGLACVIPAWRASRVDPMTALRVD